MKKILLIGDSIRKGYDNAVKEALKEAAEVYFPNENCRFAEYVLRNLHDWKKKLDLDEVDCVHWNTGLWDCLELFNDGPLTPIEFYEHFIDAICRRIKLLFPNAVVIFATSTPVIEDRFPQPDVMKRSNSDIEKYNAAAVRIVKKYGFIINDLYTLMKSAPDEFHSDMVHFYTKPGEKLIATQVIKMLADALEIPQTKINFQFDHKEVNSFIGI